MKKLMEESEQSILHTYNRFPVVFERGEGVRLYDTEGKSYLDFTAGIAVNALGYHYPGYDEALKSQIDKLTHISNLYYNEPIIAAGEKLLAASEMSKAFFTNSGTEAIEGAIKCARRYFYNKKGHAGGEIIAMENSFHGRSIGALSVTGNAHYREPFEPLMGGVRFATFNDLESVKALVNENTCGILLETVQGEGGIYPATKEFLEGVKAICEENDILLMLDEIQCGMGRTGKYFAWQHYGIKPNIMTCAKALGCGVPVGAFVLDEKAASSSLVPGDHGSTYGGNPFVCAAVRKVFDIFNKDL
ncbi:MAG: aminotransferase class III-fold pyridoxal phosphate-dependent enzyme, partial [Blautia sp.]|nr:aminotransferase class III-fold pyridoxal phosphate-dependent enzyme [Blautia sp.]